MENNKCNKWANYETWRVNLEIFDDQRFGDDAELWTNYAKRFEDIKSLADSLKRHATNLIDESSPTGLARDYANAFLQAVDWASIARHYIAKGKDNE